MGKGYLLFVVLLLVPVVSGTLVVEQDLNELIGRSDQILEGRVVGKDSFWEEGRLMTQYLFVPDEVLFGSSASTRFVSFGGIDEDSHLGQYVPGSPHFELGEEALLFLEEAEQRQWVTGFSQGHFVVDDVTGVRMAVQQLEGGLLAYEGIEVEYDLLQMKVYCAKKDRGFIEEVVWKVVCG
ncbi:hypothetical protein CMO92_03905 [Candidatus Woesearchaeota archaeon]|mgnify:FL=1|nr:hypothetical protein [Candidatus Woesearchaeota archaeon]